MTDITAAVKQAMQEAGIPPPDIIEVDGVIHRFDTLRNGDKAGWYVVYTDGISAASFGDWRQGVTHSWCTKQKVNMTAQERTQYRHQIEQAKTMREVEQRRQRTEARHTTGELWNRADEVNRHHYLDDRRVLPFGARLQKEPLEIAASWRDKPQFIPGNSLVIPVTDTNGAIHSLQFIDVKGNKRFLAGGAIQGHFFATGDFASAERVLIAEGFATAATLDMVTDYIAVAAFNAGNLKPVAIALKTAYPGADFVVCADNDRFTEGNPGVVKATEAALAIDARLAVPEFPEGAKGTDFNDLQRLMEVES